MQYLVTGNAGFIGFHVAKKLLESGKSVVGIDDVNDYYDVDLKEGRLKELEKVATANNVEYAFIRSDIAHLSAINACFEEHQPTYVINLAAQAGIRYSLENPHAYAQSNLIGFTNIIEACRHNNVKHLVYASTSSVYGANTSMPYKEEHSVDHPLQFYAATKRANELIAHSYSHLFNLQTTGLRFFTVYGPWGRPDMALFKFTKSILEGSPLQVFNHGNHTRDFTFIDDITKGVISVCDKIPNGDPAWNSDTPNPNTSNAPYRIFNIGNNSPVKLMDYIKAIEKALGKEAQMELLPRQPGDALDTYADVGKLNSLTGYEPSTSVEDGVQQFVDWYRDYYQV